MKRIFILLIMVLVLFCSCSQQANHEQSKSKTDSSPVNCPKEIFFSGTSMDEHFQSTFQTKGLVTYVNGSDNYESNIKLETEYGMLILDPRDATLNMSTSDLLQCEVEVTFKYTGYDDRAQMPSGDLESLEILNTNMGTTFYRPDFFSDEERRLQFKTYLDFAQYRELNELVNTYIGFSSTDQNDSANTILDILSPIVAFIDDCDIQVDQFKGTATITSKSVDQLDNDTYVVPKSSGTAYDVTFGFYRYDWLFFDQLDIKYDDEIVHHSFNSTQTNHDVISGSQILEYVTFDPDRDKILSASTISLRFSNEKSGQYIDHDLDQYELSALKNLCTLSCSYRELSDLLFQYKQNHTLLDE